MKAGRLALVLLFAVFVGVGGVSAQPKSLPRKSPPPVTDPKSGITVKVRLDNWVLDALGKNNKVLWTLNFFTAGGIRSNDTVSIQKLKLIDGTIEVSCQPREVSGKVDLKTGKLLKFTDLRKK